MQTFIGVCVRGNFFASKAADYLTTALQDHTASLYKRRTVMNGDGQWHSLIPQPMVLLRKTLTCIDQIAGRTTFTIFNE